MTRKMTIKYHPNARPTNTIKHYNMDAINAMHEKQKREQEHAYQVNSAMMEITANAILAKYGRK